MWKTQAESFVCLRVQLASHKERGNVKLRRKIWDIVLGAVI